MLWNISKWVVPISAGVFAIWMLHGLRVEINAAVAQLLAPSLVAIVGVICGVVNLWIRSLGFETRLKVVELEAQRCAEERNQKELLLLEKFPSDWPPFIDAMAVVGEAAKKTGDQPTFKDAIDVAITLRGG